MLDENMPTIVMSIVVVLIMLGIGTFAFLVVTSEIGYQTTQTESFDVADPTVDKECELEYIPDTITLVQQYNGYEWLTVTSAHYSVSGQTVTISASGMQG